MIACIMKHITGSVGTHNTNLGGLPFGKAATQPSSIQNISRYKVYG